MRSLLSRLFVVSEHKPVRVLLRASPRALLTRTLKPPKGFGADLPRGPPCKPIEGRWCPDPHDTKGCSEAIEVELSQVRGHDEATAKLHAGRADGPQLRWKDAISAVSDERAKTTSVSRAWRRTASWLMDMRRSQKKSTGGRLNGSSGGTTIRFLTRRGFLKLSLKR